MGFGVRRRCTRAPGRSASSASSRRPSIARQSPALFWTSANCGKSSSTPWKVSRADSKSSRSHALTPGRRSGGRVSDRIVHAAKLGLRSVSGSKGRVSRSALPRPSLRTITPRSRSRTISSADHLVERLARPSRGGPREPSGASYGLTEIPVMCAISPRPRAGVQALRVPALALFQRRIHEYLDEPPLRHRVPALVLDRLGTVRRRCRGRPSPERKKRDASSPIATDVLGSVLR